MERFEVLITPFGRKGVWRLGVMKENIAELVESAVKEMDLDNGLDIKVRKELKIDTVLNQ